MLATLAAVAMACGPSEEERATQAADSIVAIADTAGRVFRGVVAGAPVAIMVHECKVYNLADKPRLDGQRPVLAKAEFYPWPTACVRESIEGDSAYVTVTIGRQGFGAGGCCAAGGTYRSRDGRAWEKKDPAGKWQPLVTDSASATR